MTDAPKKPGWFRRLTEGLSRSSRQMSEQVVSVFAKKPLDQAMLDELEEMLIEADLGPHSAARITKRFSDEKFGKAVDEDEIKEALALAIGDELSARQGDFDALSGPRPYVVLFIGVNGSGKTTTLGKIAADLTGRGAKVLVVAGDTFRAAAVEQLKIWAERAGADFMGAAARLLRELPEARLHLALRRARSEYWCPTAPQGRSGEGATGSPRLHQSSAAETPGLVGLHVRQPASRAELRSPPATLGDHGSKGFS